MKMKLWLIIYILVFSLISGCGQGENKENVNQQAHQGNKIGTDENQNEKTTPIAKNKNQENAENQNNVQKNEQTVGSKKYGNQVFKDVSVLQTANGFSVTGKASVFEGVFQYEVVSNGKVIITDKYQTVGAPAWGDFHFTIDESLLKDLKSELNLFVYSAKDGSKTNVLTIPLSK